MTELMWIRSHVELLLQREFDECRVAVDSDGDFPFRFGTSACWVSVIDDAARPLVRVYAHAVHEVKPSARLLRELNELNVRTLTASIQLLGDVVIVQQTLSPIGLTQPVLSQALESVAGTADDIGPLLAAMFDGHTPYPARVHEGEDASG